MPAFDAIGMDAVGANSSATASTNGTASGAILTGTSTFSGGSASGTSTSTAAGANLTGTSSFAGGSASGNRSATAGGAALTGTSAFVGGSASASTTTPTTPTLPVGTITVPLSRTASFAGVQRVAVFNGKAPISIAKGALDELYFVGDFTKDLADAATSAASVAPVSSGLTVLEGPTLQGGLGVVKIGALDTSAGTKPFFTFRVTCVNNEQFDRTIQFTVQDDRTWTFGKDPDDLHFFAFDMGKDIALGKAALSATTAPVPVGVTASASAVIQGSLAIVMIGGMDVGSTPVNSCGLTMTFANTEKISRAIYFTKEDH